MGSGEHPREAERLAALNALRVLDAEPLEELQTAARMAAAVCDVPFGSINLITADRHVTAASFGGPPVHADRADSLCAMAILHQGTVYAPDAQIDERFIGNPFLQVADPPIRVFAASSIRTADGLPIGTVRVYGTEVKQLGPAQLEFLEDLADHVMRFLELRASGLVLADLAQRDDLTGLANRRALLGLLDTADPASRSDFTLGFIDLNGFKTINDTFGHAYGDEVLRGVAARLLGAVDQGELVVRLGGDEFLVRTPGLGRAAELRPRLRDALAVPIVIDGRSQPVSAAIGAAEMRAGELITDGIARAEAAMYADKPA